MAKPNSGQENPVIQSAELGGHARCETQEPELLHRPNEHSEPKSLRVFESASYGVRQNDEIKLQAFNTWRPQ